MEDGTKLFVEQIDGQHHSKKTSGAFRHTGMPSGSKECCAYNDYINCNVELKKEAIVTFTMNYGGDRPYNVTNLRRVSCPAGGYIVAKGKGDDIRYESYDADHKLVGTVRIK
ncbi:hypothetical protein INT45_004836 [Circinella minor]|uniref:Uncharacterized protein n=1 Tax=Circinella minor TaxID=1195481 RepID=A0A8H7RVM5_9FUNG|nr:hypothetical protein INT45_004836 [Circinella minor]